MRRRIHSVCYSPSAHVIPITMRYGGRRWRDGILAYMMYCPVCGRRQYYIYCNGRIVRLFRSRVA